MSTSSVEFTFQQSLPICCFLAAIGGVFEVGATAVTAVPSVRDAQGKSMRPWLYWFALAGNVGLQLTGSITSHLVATWFGPVSIVVPFFYSATLLSNMLIFGVLLGLEFFTKNMRVGTYVIVVAAVLLPIVGPDVQQDQNIYDLFHHWYASLWFSILLVLMLVTACMLFGIKKLSVNKRILILLFARATSISVNLTVSRAFVSGPSYNVLVLFVIIKIVSGAIYTFAIVVQSTAVDQARFLPLNTTMIICTNALTGIIIWEDWRVMKSWFGYICVFVLMSLGCDLLLSISSSGVPLLNEDNPKFGAHRRASMLLDFSHTPTNNNAQPTGGALFELEDLEWDDIDGEEEEEDQGPHVLQGIRPQRHQAELDDKESMSSTSSTTRQMALVSRRDAWKAVASWRGSGGNSFVHTTNNHRLYSLALTPRNYGAILEGQAESSEENALYSRGSSHTTTYQSTRARASSYSVLQ